jgi:diacylglycerol O-acyltransferase
VVAALLVGYDQLAALANVDVRSAVEHGRGVLALERHLHLAFELSWDRALAVHRLFGQVLSIYYDFAHGLVTFGLVLALYITRPGRYRRARRGLVLTNVAGLLIFLFFPVAPPRLLPGAGFTDVVAHSGTWGAWEAAGPALADHVNQFASMPSLHVAWAFWVVRAVWNATPSRTARWLSGAHLVITTGVVVGTGNHYLLDALAGLAVGEVAWRTAGWRRPSIRRRAPAVEPDRPVRVAALPGAVRVGPPLSAGEGAVGAAAAEDGAALGSRGPAG